MSLELRKRLFLWQRKSEKKAGLVFGTRGGTKQGRRNVLRDVKALCQEIGFEPPERTLHSFRHTFASNYLRNGGSVFHLQKCLGHSSLEMTRPYANLTTSDLQAVHEGLSLLGNRRSTAWTLQSAKVPIRSGVKYLRHARVVSTNVRDGSYGMELLSTRHRGVDPQQ